MSNLTIAEILRNQGVSRRAFLKFCVTMAGLMSLPPSMAPAIAKALGQTRRPSVIWLSFQECTGCTESLTRSNKPSVENLILNAVSLDYHHTLQAAAGTAAEQARTKAMAEAYGKYLLIVDGAIPTKDGGVYSTIAGITNMQMLSEVAAGAAAIVAVGTCAAFGGLPHASPNPTGAVPVTHLVKNKPIINVPGCPPIPVVITGVLAHYLTFGTIPPLDKLHRPISFYGDTIHDRCYRRPFYDQGKFAKTFDDEGARKGWCLYELGCRGPVTHNACATSKWNNGVSFPIQSGHPCLGCSEPDFWDMGRFYQPLAQPGTPLSKIALAAVAGGAAIGGAYGVYDRHKRNKHLQTHEKVTVAALEEKP
ncbi:MAG: hydrogenase small subunit [Gammaproteobacteria bacterium]|nr:hydrogenase small subunit [Gammaproteobacteria bacterium]MDH5800683.1 hydrogenase small subunit [Gammaproteobacteria bacterium]